MHCVHIFLIVKRVSFLFFCSPSRTNFQPLGDKVTLVETAWTQSGSQSMILQSGAAGPGNLIEMQILNSSWDLLSQPDALCWPSGCVLTRAPGDSGLSRNFHFSSRPQIWLPRPPATLATQAPKLSSCWADWIGTAAWLWPKKDG